MIGVVFGTTGELIKLAPVIGALERRGARPLLLCTAQQATQIEPFLEDFGLGAVDVWLARGFRGHDLERTVEVPVWAAQVAATVARRRGELRRRLRADGRKPTILVHGDTMTTVLGALAGRALGAEVGHIEAGMRSGRWRDPFPEELNRRTAAKLVQIHFAPGDRPVGNLRRERVGGRIVDTGQNTIRDAVDRVRPEHASGLDVPDRPFGLVSLHRFELIERPELFRPVLERLHAHSRREPLLFVDHSVTAAAIERHDLDGYFDEHFRRVPRQRYFAFIALLRASRFLVTDSGGCQEECAFLGHPCLIHRAVSEHDTGLDGSVVLSRMRLDVLDGFLADPDAHRTPPEDATARPSDIICDELVRSGALAPEPEKEVAGGRHARA